MILSVSAPPIVTTVSISFLSGSQLSCQPQEINEFISGYASPQKGDIDVNAEYRIGFSGEGDHP
jgi:hypothetical protein